MKKIVAVGLAAATVAGLGVVTASAAPATTIRTYGWDDTGYSAQLSVYGARVQYADVYADNTLMVQYDLRAWNLPNDVTMAGRAVALRVNADCQTGTKANWDARMYNIVCVSDAPSRQTWRDYLLQGSNQWNH